MYPEVTYVYVSPMKRCVQTAEIIYPKMMKAGAYSCNEKLRECDFGLFENHNYIELSGCPEYQAWIDSGGKLPFPEGESREAFIRRTLEGFREVVRDAQAHGPGDDCGCGTWRNDHEYHGPILPEMRMVSRTAVIMIIK